MEIPKIYRETRSRVEFAGYFKQVRDTATGRVDLYFKYPGGEIPYIGGENFLSRLVDKGFGEEEVEKILNLLLDTVATEAPVSAHEVAQSRV